MASLTKTDLHILKAMIEYYEEKYDYNIVEFSSKNCVSQSAITKGSQKYGFKGYKEFQALCRYNNDSVVFSAFLLCVRLRQVLTTEILTYNEQKNELTKIINEAYYMESIPLSKELYVNLANIVYILKLVEQNDNGEKNKEVTNRLIAENGMLRIFLMK